RCVRSAQQMGDWRCKTPMLPVAFADDQVDFSVNALFAESKTAIWRGSALAFSPVRCRAVLAVSAYVVEVLCQGDHAIGINILLLSLCVTSLAADTRLQPGRLNGF